MKFRELRPDEIECRIGTANAKGVSVLLYKTSRTDMAILDETVGAENWKTSYEEIRGELFCTLWIKCGDEWIGKQDCGIESKQDDGNEKKAAASDALKRMTVAGRKREDLKTSIVELFISITLLLTLDSARPQGVSLSKVISKKVIGKGSPSERDKWLLKVNSE